MASRLPATRKEVQSRRVSNHRLKLHWVQVRKGDIDKVSALNEIGMTGDDLPEYVSAKESLRNMRNRHLEAARLRSRAIDLLLMQGGFVSALLVMHNE